MRVSYENVCVRLGGKDILKGATLHTHEGKMVGIVGANGCGKSTLIKTTFGLIPKQSGEILIDGRPAHTISPREMASLVGYVGQDAGCAFDFSVHDVVAMGLYARKDKGSHKTAVHDALVELGIERFEDRSIQRLSGGERKMVFIARALVQGAEMFILDEPTNHLDIHHQLFVMDYLKRAGKTTLLVNHDLRLATHYCDYLYMIADGRVYAEGTPLEVLTEKNVHHVFGIHGCAVKTESGILDFSLFETPASE